MLTFSDCRELYFYFWVSPEQCRGDLTANFNSSKVSYTAYSATILKQEFLVSRTKSRPTAF
jgi:hypothetical protein